MRAKFVLLGSVVLVAVAIVQNLAVIERVNGALWQRYKFKGYGGGGYITLSRETGWWFYGLSFLLLGLSTICLRACSPETRFGRMLAGIAAILFAGGIILYTLLGHSSLNVWAR
jgi:hypothetical protein